MGTTTETKSGEPGLRERKNDVIRSNGEARTMPQHLPVWRCTDGGEGGQRKDGHPNPRGPNEEDQRSPVPGLEHSVATPRVTQKPNLSLSWFSLQCGLGASDIGLASPE